MLLVRVPKVVVDSVRVLAERSHSDRNNAFRGRES